MTRDKPLLHSHLVDYVVLASKGDQPILIVLSSITFNKIVLEKTHDKEMNNKDIFLLSTV